MTKEEATELVIGEMTSKLYDRAFYFGLGVDAKGVNSGEDFEPTKFATAYTNYNVTNNTLFNPKSVTYYYHNVYCKPIEK